MHARRTAAGVLAAGLATALVATATVQPAAAVTSVTPVAAGSASGLVADPTNRATPEEKIEALAAIKVVPDGGTLLLNDQAFVFDLWRQAADGTFIKAGALRAYDSDDPDAAYEFITAGIFTAAADDAQAEVKEAQARALRRSVAVTVGLDPSDTALIEKNDRDFIFSVWQRVAVGSHVWTAARDAVADGSDQADWTAFLNTGAAAAHEQDVLDAIAIADAQRAAQLAAEQLATAKRSLLQLLLLPVSDQTVNAPDRQYVLHVHNNAKGAEVRLASQIALNAPDADLEKALKDFIFTGGAAANRRDEDTAAAKELAGYVAQVTRIRDDALADGLASHLVKAAKDALAANTLVALQTFLLKGQEDARALDNQFKAKRTWDFDGDKKPDIIAADKSTGILWLYRGKGDGTFDSAVARKQIGTGWARWTAIFTPGDFNGDGFNDVITRDTAGGLYLYRGNGRGGWVDPSTNIKIGSGWNDLSQVVSPGDFDGDTFPDVIARNADGQLLLYRGNGKGGWLNGTDPAVIGAGFNSYNLLIATGDFSGDGFADLAARNPAGQVKLYRGNGRGSWLNGSSPDTIGTGGWNSWNLVVSPGDWNSDGRPDVITRNAAGELFLYRGNGKGGWIDPSSNIKIGNAGWNAFSFVF